MPEYRVLTAGDTALVIEFGDHVDRRISSFVLALARRLDQDRPDGVVETVPTFRSLMIHFDPLVIPAADLTAHVEELMADLRMAEYDCREWQLPVCYDAVLALDLDEVAARTGLTASQVIERHASVTYHVYMLGFLPGLAYMGDVAPELALPRREIPRPRVAAGSVAIATTMSIIFPRESPTGWYVIGRSPVPLWRRPQAGIARDAGRGAGSGALLAPGDKVRFAPVSLREFEELAARAEAGALDVVPHTASAGAAA
jgi:inhibitor of KinA